MTDAFYTIERTLVRIIGNELDTLHANPNTTPTDYATITTALALHRLANTWERRVQLAEATANAKGININPVKPASNNGTVNANPTPANRKVTGE